MTDYTKLGCPKCKRFRIKKGCTYWYCEEHIKGLNVTSMEEMAVQPDVKMKIEYDAKTNEFAFLFVEQDRALFNFRMSQEAFEQLSSDMVRAVKDLNLSQAKDYMENQKCQKSLEQCQKDTKSTKSQ